MIKPLILQIIFYNFLSEIIISLMIMFHLVGLAVLRLLTLEEKHINNNMTLLL